MRPRERRDSGQNDLFRARLDPNEADEFATTHSITLGDAIMSSRLARMAKSRAPSWACRCWARMESRARWR